MPNAQLAETMKQPVFGNLPLVREGRIYPGGKDTVAGFEVANYNLDQFDAALTKIAAGD